MSPDAIELPARDEEIFVHHERLPEHDEGILAWMGRHKLVSTLAGSAILAGGAYATPAIRESLAAKLALLRSFSARVGAWIEAFKTFIKNIGKAGDIANKGGAFVGGAIQGGLGIVGAPIGILGAIGKNALPVAKGFVQGAGAGAAMGANILVPAPARFGLSALRKWWMGK